jgi:hypothetical protein
MINVTEAQESAPTSGENGREPGLELSSDSKVREEAGGCSHSGLSSLSLGRMRHPVVGPGLNCLSVPNLICLKEMPPRFHYRGTQFIVCLLFSLE